MKTRLGDWFSILIYGGTNSLSPAEASLLSVAADSLSADERQILQRQIADIRLVQRPQPRRVIICFYRKNSDSPQFAQKDYENCLARITWKHPDGKKAKVKVMLHNGRFQSMEGHIPESPIRSNDCTVEIWPALSSTLPGAVDRIEHGRKKNAQVQE